MTTTVSDAASRRPIKICVATWNIDSEKYSNRPLDDWLRRKDNADIYAIGFQEMNFKSKVIVSNRRQICSVEIGWLQQIRRCLVGYERVARARLAGTLLLIYVRQSFRTRLARIQTGVVATGTGNTLGNKGAVGARMDLCGRRLAFVCNHLAAGSKSDHLERRNQDLNRVISKLRFDMNALQKSDKMLDTKYGLSDHDAVFFFGDLNYRLDNSADVNIARLMREEKWEQILSADQFIQSRQRHHIPCYFYEGRITFPPTYRYIPWTNQYSNEREPAYTDRILLLGLEVDLLDYSAYPNYWISDHRPLSALYHLRHGVADSTRFNLTSYPTADLCSCEPCMKRHETVCGKLCSSHNFKKTLGYMIFPAKFV